MGVRPGPSAPPLTLPGLGALPVLPVSGSLPALPGFGSLRRCRASVRFRRCRLRFASGAAGLRLASGAAGLRLASGAAGLRSLPALPGFGSLPALPASARFGAAGLRSSLGAIDELLAPVILPVAEELAPWRSVSPRRRTRSQVRHPTQPCSRPCALPSSRRSAGRPTRAPRRRSRFARFRGSAVRVISAAAPRPSGRHRRAGVLFCRACGRREGSSGTTTDSHPAPRWKAPAPGERVPATTPSGASVAPADRRGLVRRRDPRLPRSSVPGRDARSGQACHARSRGAAFGSSQPRARRPGLALPPSTIAPLERRLRGMSNGRSNDPMKRMTALLGALLLVLVFGARQAVAADGGGAAQDAGQFARSGQTAGAGSGALPGGAVQQRVVDSRVEPRQRRGGLAVELRRLQAPSQRTATRRARAPPSRRRVGTAPIRPRSPVRRRRTSRTRTRTQPRCSSRRSNDAQSIRVLSPGNGGDLTQSNSATAGAAALNGNETDQSTDQSQGGRGYGSDQTQIAGQAASNDQSADADATAVQVKPSNSASSIRVLSPGNDGDVSQSNAATAVGIAANGNSTDQSTDQSQGGGGYGSDQQQVAGQEASNEQTADADATAVQIKPSNTASSIRVLSPGNGGNVSQSNSTTAVAAGLNGNKTDQSSTRARAAAWRRPPCARTTVMGSPSRTRARTARRSPARARRTTRRRRGCDGGPGEAVELCVVDPGAEPGQRR